MRSPESPLIQAVADVLSRARGRRPRIHCITNAVAQTYTANMLLALGAVPSMTISVEEIGGFVASADALLVNLGTFDPERREATLTALEIAGDERVPWLLDPVFIDRSEPRAAFAKALLSREPVAIRLNRAEFAAIAGNEADEAALKQFALEQLMVVGLTGEIDIVSDGARQASVANGHALMARVTAMGCAGAAINAAFLAVEDDAWLATIASLAVLGVAGEIAAAKSDGPGSFATAILDAVYALDRATLIQRARVS